MSDLVVTSAGVSSGDTVYIGQDDDGRFVIVTRSALDAMGKAECLDTIAMVPELWDAEWDWEHPMDASGRCLNHPDCWPGGRPGE